MAAPVFLADRRNGDGAGSTDGEYCKESSLVATFGAKEGESGGKGSLSRRTQWGDACQEFAYFVTLKLTFLIISLARKLLLCIVCYST